MRFDDVGSKFDEFSYGVANRGASVRIPNATIENNKEILLKGVVLENVRIRSYPKTTMLSHVLGYVNYDRIGSAGLEQRYNKFLQGKEGYRRGKKDAKRSEVYDQREIDTPPQDGSTLVLTIDQEIQDKVEDVIYRMHRKYCLLYTSPSPRDS